MPREGGLGRWAPKTRLKSEGQGSVTKKADEVTGHRKHLQDVELDFYMGCMRAWLVRASEVCAQSLGHWGHLTHVSPGCRLDLLASGWTLGDRFLDHTKFFPVSVPLLLLFHLSGIIPPPALVTQLKHYLSDCPLGPLEILTGPPPFY